MLSATLVFILGLVGLLIGGHLVVDGAARLGVRLGLTPTVIGLTIVAAGTSAPELAVVLQSVSTGDTPLAMGSIIGSNIANVLLVLGLAAAMGAIMVENRIVRVDIPIMILASSTLLILALDRRLSRLDGLVLFTALVVFVGWTVRASRTGREAIGGDAGADTSAEDDDGEGPGRPRRLAIDLGVLLLGIAALALAARYVVSGAEDIATTLGVPDLIIGLTIVALGTSAPEIVTTVIAAMAGQRDLAVGNAVGSNIFNILLVLGLGSMVVDGLPISADALELDLPIMLAAAVACLPMVFWDNRIDRWEGAVFVGYYIAYLIFLVLDATGHRASDPFAFVILFFVIPLNVLTIAVIVRRQRAAASVP